MPLVLALAGCGSTALRGAGTSESQAGLDAPRLAGSGQTSSVSGTVGDDRVPGEVAPGSGTLIGGSLASSAGGIAGVPQGSSSGHKLPSTVLPSPGLPSATSGPAATSKEPVKVGVMAADLGAIAAVFGQDASDPLKSVRAFVAGLNAAGGIGGRPVEAVYYVADSGADASTSEQKACTAFTQDNTVDVVMAGSSTGVLASCLLRAGIPMFDSNSLGPDAQQMSQYPNWFLPAGMRLDRSALAVLQLAVARGVLTKGSKLGVLADTCASTDRIMTSTVLPAAQRLGLSVTRGSFKCVDNLVTDLVPVTTAVQSETLRFSTAGVKAVIVVSAAEAFAVSQMSSVASQQHFFPTYLVSSNAYPYGNSQSDAIIKISPDALPHMLGAGYLPLLDVGAGDRPDSRQKQARDRCTKADPSQFGAASDTGTGKYLKQNVFFSACDTFFVMKATLEASGMRFDYRDVARGYAQVLRSGLVSAVFTGGSYGGLGGERRDGAGFVQAFSYDTSRKAFRYVGSKMVVS
jgi:hypothetical protein